MLPPIIQHWGCATHGDSWELTAPEDIKATLPTTLHATFSLHLRLNTGRARVGVQGAGAAPTTELRGEGEQRITQ
jgi:hypothetical protein